MDQKKKTDGLAGSAESLTYSVPSIALASSLVLTITFISLIVGIFSNKKV